MSYSRQQAEHRAQKVACILALNINRDYSFEQNSPLSHLHTVDYTADAFAANYCL